MPEKQNKTQSINLDEISNKVKDVQKRPSLEAIIPSLIHSFDKHFVKEEDGHFKEFEKADDKNKQRLADILSEELLYILATKYFKIPTEKFKEIKEINKSADEFGDHIFDGALAMYMGINRNAILKAVKGLEKFNYESIMGIGMNASKAHSSIITSKLLEPITTEHTPELKKWISQKSEGRFEKEIKNLYDIDKLKQYFVRTIAKDYGQAEYQ